MPRSLNPLPLLASLSLAAVGGALGTAWYVTNRINPPRRRTFLDSYTFTPWELDVPFEEVTIEVPDGVRLRGWWLPQRSPRGTVIACHGHTGRKEDTLGIGTRSWRAGYNVLLFDFRGRGDSDDWPNSLVSREVDDLIAAVAAARQRAPGLPIGVIGFSMGGAVAILAAAREPAIAAVVADCAFSAVSEVVNAGFRQLFRGVPPALLLQLADELLHRRHGYRFSTVRPIDAIGAIAPRPVMLIHAGGDTLVPVSHAHALYAAAAEPKSLWICEGVEHCGAYFLDRQAYVGRVVGFFDQYLGSVG